MEKTYQIMSVACVTTFFFVAAFGVTLTPSTKMTSTQVKKELKKVRSDIKKIDSIKQKKALSSTQTKNLSSLQKKELRLINRDIQLNPSTYIQERKKLEVRRKALKNEIAQKEKVGSAATQLHAELSKVNTEIDRTKTIYEIRADRNRDLYLWGKDQEKSSDKELEKTRVKLQQQGLSESEIQKKVDDYREKEKATLKSKIDNLKKEYDKELLRKYGYKIFPTPTREEIERVGVEESKILAEDIKRREAARRLAEEKAKEAKEVAKANYYTILGIPSTASQSEIKKAYRALSLKVHPDKVEQEEKEIAAEAFKVIGAANETLSDAAKKEQYDNWLKTGTRSAGLSIVKITPEIYRFIKAKTGK